MPWNRASSNLARPIQKCIDHSLWLQRMKRSFFIMEFYNFVSVDLPWRWVIYYGKDNIRFDLMLLWLLNCRPHIIFTYCKWGYFICSWYIACTTAMARHTFQDGAKTWCCDCIRRENLWRCDWRFTNERTNGRFQGNPCHMPWHKGELRGSRTNVSSLVIIQFHTIYSSSQHYECNNTTIIHTSY